MIYASVLPNAGTIEIDGEKYGVVVVVMEASDGKRYYDYTVTGKNESPTGLLADLSTTEVDEESGRPFTGLSENTVAEGIEKDNDDRSALNLMKKLLKRVKNEPAD